MEMKVSKFEHVSETDGLVLSAVRTEPERAEDIRGTVLIVHGMCEHKGRYEPVMEFLATHGYLAIAYDHRGHGESVKEEGDLGYLYDGGYEAMIEDMHEMVGEARKYAAERTGREDLPLTVLAHSMGTLVARCYLRKYDSELDRLVLCGCPSKRGGTRAGLALLKVLKIFKGERGRSKLADVIVGGGYDKKFKKENVKYAWVNSDPNEVKLYNEDPLCGYTFTLNGYENLVKLMMLTYRDSDQKPGNPELPVRFFSGSEDPCAITHDKLRAAAKFLRRQGYKNVKVRIYPGMRHEILREREKAEVFAGLIWFLEDNGDPRDEWHGNSVFAGHPES